MPATAQHNMKRPAAAAATITALLPTGERIVRELYEGDSVVIGSLEGCDVQLQLEGVASTHCILGVDDGTVWLRDCYSPSGTFVDDRRVSQTRLQQSASVRVGSCDLSLHLHGAPSEPDDLRDLDLHSRWQDELDSVGSLAEPTGDDARSDPTPTARPERPDPEAQVASSALEPTIDGRVDASLEQLEHAHSEIERLQEQLERYQQQEAFRLASSVAPEVDPLQEEMIELLRTEVSELQNELAQREAQLAELRGNAAPASVDDTACVSQEELETLVARLEQLLEELQRKDEHVELLEETLRASEDANRAEQEERFQLEAWVRDIEQRVSEREAEWQASVEKLQQTIDEQAEHRRHLEQSLQEALTGGQSATLQREMTKGLREEIAGLKSQLQASEQQRAALQEQLRSRPKASEHATREQQAEIARERAELARQRADLETMRQQNTAQPRPSADAQPSSTAPQIDAPAVAAAAAAAAPSHRSDADERIRALRQHLAQTSDEEVQEERPASLGARIANLWRKLESSD